MKRRTSTRETNNPNTESRGAKQGLALAAVALLATGVFAATRSGDGEPAATSHATEQTGESHHAIEESTASEEAADKGISPEERDELRFARDMAIEDINRFETIVQKHHELMGEESQGEHMAEFAIEDGDTIRNVDLSGADSLRVLISRAENKSGYEVDDKIEIWIDITGDDGESPQSVTLAKHGFNVFLKEDLHDLDPKTGEVTDFDDLRQVGDILNFIEGKVDQAAANAS